MSGNYEIEKSLPSSLDAERVVLGAILTDDTLLRHTGRLAVTDFYRAEYKHVFAAMLELNEENKPIDPILIFEILKRNDTDDLISVAEITGLSYGVPPKMKIRKYVSEILEKSVRRQAAFRLENLQKKLLNEQISLKDFCKALGSLESDLREAHAEETDSFKTLAEILGNEVIPTLDAYYREEVSEFLIPTGFPEIDEILGGGLYLSDMLAIVAPPKSAKSAFALQLALNFSEREPTALLSLEMSNLQNGLRFIAQKSYRDSRALDGTLGTAIASHWLRPGIYKHTYEQASAVAASLFDSKLLMCQKPLDWKEIQAEVRRLVKEKGVRVIIVDYWQLVGNDKRGKNRADLLAEIAKGLKQLGQELNICVIVLGQFNQDGLKLREQGKELSTLYLEGSGELVKSANIVLTIDIKEANLNDVGNNESRYGTLTFRPLRSGADKRLECLFYGKYLTVEIQ